MNIEDMRKVLVGRTIDRIESRDKDFSLTMILDDGTGFVIYAHSWLGGHCIGYDVKPLDADELVQTGVNLHNG